MKNGGDMEVKVRTTHLDDALKAAETEKLFETNDLDTLMKSLTD